MFGELMTTLPDVLYIVVSATNESERAVASVPNTGRMHAFDRVFQTVEEAELFIMEYGYPDVYFSAITYNIVEYTRPPF